MPETVTTAEQLNDLRQRYLDGKDWSREELKSAINYMIGDRLRAAREAPAKKTKGAKPIPVSLDDLLAPTGDAKTKVVEAAQTQRAAPPSPEVDPSVPSKKPDTSGFF
jgi:hypothetical protein